MSPRLRAFIRLLVLLAVLALLIFIFPSSLRFLEMAGRELRYFWWVLLIIALAIWLIWGIGKKPRP